jgi:hypothetical protein
MPVSLPLSDEDLGEWRRSRRFFLGVLELERKP